MANEVQFKRGLKADLPSTKTTGQILFTTDTNEMFIDTSTIDRFQVQGPSMTEATSSVAGSDGSVPAPAASSQSSVLTGDRIVSLNTSDVFGNTPIAGDSGYVHVPDSLVNSYQSCV